MKRLLFPTFLVTLYATAIAFIPVYISIARTTKPWQAAFAEGMALAPGILTISIAATILLTPAVYYALRGCNKLGLHLKALEEKDRAADNATQSEPRPETDTGQGDKP